ncbi:MAG: xanthine dehydrogenase family protein subunit M [Chloroflexi bacterium CFX7]|nr:xanthine dehydrogenase family protein subunit M [Chloroflexi bacterium CFX7]MCK6563631.1 xanthine dehydrogenase family protein subunit M [Dehalococcoidia bacterium]
MEAFDYVAPRTLAEAYSHLGNARRVAALAGGTDLIVQLREARRACDLVVDLKHIPELMAITIAGDGSLQVGAAAPLAGVYENPEVCRRWPALIDAATIIGGTAVQGRATLGGNLCNASPAADSPPALMVLGARLRIGSAAGTRELPVEEFFAGPGQNVLGPGELLLQVLVPPMPARSGAFYHRFIPRNEMDIAVASAGAWLQLGPGETIEAARIAIGAVAPTPLMVPEAAQALVGSPAGPQTFARAAEAAAQAARPITDMRGSAAQRRHLVGVLTRRALENALQRATEAR